MLNPDQYLSYSTHISYLIIFLMPALGGHIIPIPEEVVLLLAGYLAGAEVNNIYLTILVALAGVLVGDNLMYWLSYRGSHFLDRFKNRLSVETLNRFQDHLHTHMRKTIFLGRFIVGLRFLSPITAGSNKVPWKIFQFYNALGALIYVPLLVLLGYRFHYQIAAVIDKIVYVRHIIVLILAAILTFIITKLVHHYFFKNNSQPNL